MRLTLGMDEVGRGCWAGPVLVGGVILLSPIVGLQDSKLLSKRKRRTLYDIIHQHAVCATGQASAAEIDQLGLNAALRLAYQRAFASITHTCREIIIDGNVNYLPTDSRVRCVIRADQTVPAVSAASIIAKVTRDTLMAAVGEAYPGYGFEHHKGYGTAEHAAALRTLGPSAIHRRSVKPVKNAYIKLS